jgi:triosephosphate isomerase
MRKRLVIGNWKMYIESPEEAREFAVVLRRKVRGLTGVDVSLAVPHPFMKALADMLESSPIKVGAQTVSPQIEGAHTGEVSAKMLKEVGALFSIIGHSERRAQGESETVVRAQLEHALEVGLAPVLCVGESSRGHEGEHFSFIEAELTSALRNIPKNILRKLVIAYEPIWAIGKSAAEAMKPGELQETVIFIRKVLAELLDRQAALKVPVLYGGSVDHDNAPQLIAEGGIQGFLVGRASAHIESFLAIIQAVRQDQK